MDTETLRWSTASSLPHTVHQATGTLCGDQLYMLGGFNQTNKYSKSVFTCSLAALVNSCQPQSLLSQLKAFFTKMWHQLADTPVTLSTCASLHGRLLAVGGCDSEDKETTAIHMYNTATNSWEVISHMVTPRHQCLVAVLPHNELMVVGSYTPGPGGVTDSVEIATIVWHSSYSHVLFCVSMELLYIWQKTMPSTTILLLCILVWEICRGKWPHKITVCGRSVKVLHKFNWELHHPDSEADVSHSLIKALIWLVNVNTQVYTHMHHCHNNALI